MPEPRYHAALQSFLRQWRPNDPELDRRFLQAVRELLAAVLTPPASAFGSGNPFCRKPARAAAVIAEFCGYRTEVMPRELAGDFERRSATSTNPENQ